MTPADPPAELGRGVIVGAGAAAPAAWANAERIEVGPEEVADPSAVVARLHAKWAAREPVVVALDVDPVGFRAPQSIVDPPYGLAPDLDLPRDRLHHLVWANNYDARGGEQIWWWGEKAIRLGAAGSGAADVALPDGRDAWIDGGPRWSAPATDALVVEAGAVEGGSLDSIPRERPGARADLAPDQLAAVEHHGGPVRVIAPAGSGKTRVLTERMRHLLADRGYRREAVIAVAYNKLAQTELEGRLAGLDPRTRTLNSLGYSLLNRHRGTRARVLSEPESRDLAAEVFPIPRQRRTNTDPIGPYIDALGVCRLGLVPPSEVEEGRDDVPGLADGFDAYRERLAAVGAIDFDEQIYATLEALLRDGEFRRRVQGEHRHLLVDEFQDLTPAHVLMIRLLAMPAFDVFGVGDDDQTIYDHAGADPRFLVDYGDYFPGAERTALEVNYRCAEAIVSGAATLLGYNRLRVPKTIRAADGADPDPGALELRERPSAEAAATLVELIREWLADPEVGPGDVAVLARVNSLLLAPQVALWSAGVPVASAVRGELLERTGAAAALAWLRVAVDPENLIGADLEAIRRRPSRGFPRWISKWFANCRSLDDLRVVGRRIDDERVAGKVDEMAADIGMLAGLAAAGATTRELLEAVRDRIGLGSAMAMLDGSKGSEATASHLDDLEGLIQVADLHDEPGGFEPWLRAALESSAGGEGVRLATVHRVKGREWDRVAVYGANDGLIPHRLSESWEAERRVLHVAITRARHRSVVLADRERPSPFLAEIRGEAKEAATKPVVSADALGAATARSRRATGRTVEGSPLEGAGPVARAADGALREWRRLRSEADGVPAFVVLSNRQLEGIAAAMPADERALLACNGIGPTKLERYGEDILAVLATVRE
ncbi:MAG TPA: ATP-dependent DNA helicase UvrD2 [Solirubrobacterales bacterium]|nr:ATP-dependent DNA helicase UvrD2 [Solirubrobacterales bacterium]